MTPERFEEVARFVVQLARDDPSGNDLVTLVLAACYMLPENVRLRELRSRSSAGRQERLRRLARPNTRSVAQV